MGRLLLWYLQAFAPPDPLDALMIHAPGVVPQQSHHLPIPIATILTGQLNDGRRQRGFIVRWLALIPLGGAGLAQHVTDTAFGEAQGDAAVLHRLLSARWA